ncbi:hypothetical protein NIES2119_05475 [[Phormidium ambiguum] IAM M-71]|uniref:Uncharacterized protein n=1 Tax=[Phormidium ambiguum] IAM M-71 TaxID=454136 RepID=A0A1U7IQJ5_9CYAN|nr:hypothetical protein [Phormidium ambiguum]OKH39707.1 hypothetical protein NIES2119_05475 [Phormidium ambiguum IAM M-71]
MPQTKAIDELVDNLPTKNTTVYLLQGLDFVVPGEWENIVGFDNMIRSVTGKKDQDKIKKIRDRALKLYNDESQGYQRAIWLYQIADTADSAMGAMAIANKLSEKVSFLSFLNKLTPKSDVIQSVDLGLKLVIELLAFSAIHQIPVTNFGAFANALNKYSSQSLMRIAALVCVDALVPLGPDFVRKVQTNLTSINSATLQQNPTFQNISGMIPGNSTTEKLGFMGQNFAAVQGWMNNFVQSHQLTQQNVVSHLKQYIDFADDKLDYVAAFLDVSTNYYQHTGTQSVARHLIEKATT